MTQEDKELLLKDLCARLNTNLVCSIYRVDDQGIVCFSSKENALKAIKIIGEEELKQFYL